MLREIDRAHAAFADLRDDAIRPEGGLIEAHGWPAAICSGHAMPFGRTTLVTTRSCLAVTRARVDTCVDTAVILRPCPQTLLALLDRPELVELRARIAATLDADRPDAVARRRKTHQRTARENLADLVDPGSFSEYGGLALAAQRAAPRPGRADQGEPRRWPDRRHRDGFGGARVMVLIYDYTVFAGTQGGMGHKKLDRMLALAAEHRLPVVLFAEGGGGRPNDTDMPLVAGLDTTSFRAFAALNGLAPLIGIVSGRCFAGNAALLGLCDVVIATDNSSIGMGGPAMIEGGGLGTFSPEEVGPIEMQTQERRRRRPRRGRSRSGRGREAVPRVLPAARRQRGPAPIRPRFARSSRRSVAARSRSGRSSRRSRIPARCSSSAAISGSPRLPRSRGSKAEPSA